MSLLTKDQILNADDLPTKEIEVPQWGGNVLIRTMTAFERDRFEKKMFGDGDKKNRPDNIRATLASLAIVDESGDRMFTDKDIVALGKKSAAALDRVFAEIQKLNAVSDKDVEEMAGNSEETPGASSDGELPSV